MIGDVHIVNLIGKRLRLVREHVGLSQTQMARALEIGQSTISQLEGGHSLPSFEVLQKLVERYNVNLNWLVNGSGDMLHEERDDAKDEMQDEALNAPLVHASVHAGYMHSKGSREFLWTLDRFRIPGFEDRDDIKIFEVEGDSMQPTFIAGDYVVCSRIAPHGAIPNNTIAVVMTTERFFLKRISVLGGHSGGIIMKSDSPSYEPQIVPLEQVLEIWIVEMKMTTSVDNVVIRHSLRIGQLERELEEMKQNIALLIQRSNEPPTG